jgi:hypothetical protein
MLTVPRSLAKSSTGDLSRPMVAIVRQQALEPAF